MTRFGEIPPLWQIFKNIWQNIEGLIGFGQSFQLTLAQFGCFIAIFHCYKWPNIENTICHLVTLVSALGSAGHITCLA